MRIFLMLSLCFCILSFSAHAGEALITDASGVPISWIDNNASAPISLHISSGSCGRFSNAQLVTAFEDDLARWTDISTVDIGFDIVTGDLGLVDVCNYDDVLSSVEGQTSTQAGVTAADDINPVVFDNTGEIIDAVAGVGSKLFVLGFAAPDGFAYSGLNIDAITDGQAVFNCYCADDGSGAPQNSDCTEGTDPILFSDDDLEMTRTHEMGHFLNLDHSYTNAQFLFDDVSEDSFIPSGVNYGDEENLPLMFPVSWNPELQKTPTEDDKVALSSLYPSATFFTPNDPNSEYCKVIGTLQDQFNEDMSCTNLNVTDSAHTDGSLNVSFVTGMYGTFDENGDCVSGCGNFEFYLKPSEAAHYEMSAESIYGAFTGGSSVGPCVNAQLGECTSDSNDDHYIGNCTDSNSSTVCLPCVESESLLSSSNGTIADQLLTCTAGGVVDLGIVGSNSVSIASAATGTRLVDGQTWMSKNQANLLETKFLKPGAPKFATDPCSSPASSSGGCRFSDSSQGSFLLIGIFLLLTTLSFRICFRL